MKIIAPGLLFLLSVFGSCRHRPLPNEAMIKLLEIAKQHEFSPENNFCPEALLKFSDSIINNSSDQTTISKARYDKATALLELGEEQKAIDIYQYLLNIELFSWTGSAIATESRNVHSNLRFFFSIFFRFFESDKKIFWYGWHTRACRRNANNT